MTSLRNKSSLASDNSIRVDEIVHPRVKAFEQDVYSVGVLGLAGFVAMTTIRGRYCLLYTSDAADE